MTLTAILPTLRASIPDPIDLRRWPEGTRATVRDLVVAGQSMNTVATQRKTPCVFDAGECGPWACDCEARGVLLVRVVAVGGPSEPVPSYAGPELILDVDPRATAADWSEVRLINRVSTSKQITWHLVSGEPVMVDLPADVGPGDVLVAPCGR